MTPNYINFLNIQDSEDIVLIAVGFQVGPREVAPVAQLMVTPAFLKRIQNAINTAVDKHERQYGHISDGSITLPKAVEVN